MSKQLSSTHKTLEQSPAGNTFTSVDKAFRGWLLDLYVSGEDGVKLWFIGEEDDWRVSFTHNFPVTFYAAGDHSELRRLWKQLQDQEGILSLRRTQKQDVFVADPVDVMEICVSNLVRLGCHHPMPLHRPLRRLPHGTLRSGGR
jgi:hypothetical protein